MSYEEGRRWVEEGRTKVVGVVGAFDSGLENLKISERSRGNILSRTFQASSKSTGKIT